VTENHTRYKKTADANNTQILMLQTEIENESRLKFSALKEVEKFAREVKQLESQFAEENKYKDDQIKLLESKVSVEKTLKDEALDKFKEISRSSAVEIGSLKQSIITKESQLHELKEENISDFHLRTNIQNKLDSTNIELEKQKEENKSKDLKLRALRGELESLSSLKDDLVSNYKEALLEAKRKEADLKNESFAQVSKLNSEMQSKKVLESKISKLELALKEVMDRESDLLKNKEINEENTRLLQSKIDSEKMLNEVWKTQLAEENKKNDMEMMRLESELTLEKSSKNEAIGNFQREFKDKANQIEALEQNIIAKESQIENLREEKESEIKLRINIHHKLEKLAIDFEKLKVENETKDSKVLSLRTEVDSITSMKNDILSKHAEVLREVAKREANIKNESATEISKLKIIIQSEKVYKNQITNLKLMLEEAAKREKDLLVEKKKVEEDARQLKEKIESEKILNEDCKDRFTEEKKIMFEKIKSLESELSLEKTSKEKALYKLKERSRFSKNEIDLLRQNVAGRDAQICKLENDKESESKLRKQIQRKLENVSIDFENLQAENQKKDIKLSKLGAELDSIKLSKNDMLKDHEKSLRDALLRETNFKRSSLEEISKLKATIETEKVLKSKIYELKNSLDKALVRENCLLKMKVNNEDNIRVLLAKIDSATIVKKDVKALLSKFIDLDDKVKLQDQAIEKCNKGCIEDEKLIDLFE
jgi:chromosome segregation ATPase